MNELYFTVIDSAWRSGRPSACFFDELNEQLAACCDAGLRDAFMRNYFEPLLEVYHRIYDTIRLSRPTEAAVEFQVAIPLSIAEEGRPAYAWYVERFPGGEYTETAKDFLCALTEAAKRGTGIMITGE